MSHQNGFSWNFVGFLRLLTDFAQWRTVEEEISDSFFSKNKLLSQAVPFPNRLHIMAFIGLRNKIRQENIKTLIDLRISLPLDLSISSTLDHDLLVLKKCKTCRISQFGNIDIYNPVR